MTVDELLQALRASRLKVLHRKTSVSDRHANLAHVIQGSFELLLPQEQDLLKRLSLFESGFFRDAADFVLDDPDLDEILDTLCQNSLISVNQQEGRMRFKILDSVREYLNELSSQSDHDQTNHCTWYARLAQTIGSAFGSGEWPKMIPLFWLEVGNMRRGWKFAIEHSLGAVGEYASSLAHVLFELGLVEDFEELVSAGIREARSGSRAGDLMRLYGLQGAMRRRLGDDASALEIWDERRRLAEQIADRVTLADVQLDLAVLALDGKDFEAAHRAAVSARIAASEVGHRIEEAKGAALEAYCLARLDRDDESVKCLVSLDENSQALPLTEQVFVDAYVARAMLEVGQTDAGIKRLLDVLDKALACEYVSALGWLILDLDRYTQGVSAADVREVLSNLPVNPQTNLGRSVIAYLGEPQSVSRATWVDQWADGLKRIRRSLLG